MKRIAVLEDEEIIRKGLRTILEEVIGGYEVVAEAENGRNILALIEERRVDLVIADIRMRGVDGLEALRTIRSVHRDLPVILLSGHADFSYAREALKHGARAYLLKPLDRTELASALASVFGTPPAAGPDPGTADAHGEADAADSHRIVREVKRIVAENLDADLSLMTVADRVRLNSQYLSALFKERTGENFSRYVARLRVERARHLLDTTNLKVFEIATLCGFGNVKNFYAVFKDIAGVTPSAFRNG